MCPSRIKVHWISNAQKASFPRQEISPGPLPAPACPPCRGSGWPRGPSVGTTEQAGRTCCFWNSGLDKRPLLSLSPEAKGQEPDTENWMLSAIPCLLLLRSLEPASAVAALAPHTCWLDFCSPSLATSRGLSCGLLPGQPISLHSSPASWSWRTQGRTGAQRTSQA